MTLIPRIGRMHDSKFFRELFMTTMQRIKGVLAALLVSGAASAMAADVTLYSYHQEPPFVTGEGKGLTYDFADYLSKKTGGNPNFKVALMPRARVDQAVQGADFQDAVL